ncbi:DMT family transporter [Thermobrachium celere]|uniref:Permease of the drug/metabolite transporter (DMT) superfamily n=1 Tax=Thermobrachium celere DSM 8682 TaxID=941824 RepID=R7RMZ9_9CLOT|nr:DMT family transporter [Thermobrachium celere]CDF57424.1 Permease of the drug/metabolite transporter (DMT) superfamily [Thermobrachium celere DSM 8682]
MKKYLPYLAGVTMSLIFGFSFIFSKAALEMLSTFELLFLRFTTATITMSILILLGVVKVNLKGKNIKPLILVAFWQPIIYFIMETKGLQYTTSSEAGVMMAFIPVLVAILAAFLLDEKPTKLQWIFIAVSVIGVITIVLGGGNLETKGQLKGIIFLLSAVFSASMFNIYSRRASQNFTPYETTYSMMILGMIVFGILYLIQGLINGDINILSKINTQVSISIFYLGVLSSVFAFLLVNYSLSKLPASQSSVFANLTTVVSVIAGITIRGESFETYKLIGAVMIIVGVWGTNYFGILNKNRA